MTTTHNLPVTRSLLDRPQSLGVLPTLWFWNDRERQQLMTPLFVVTQLPLAPLFFLLLWLKVSIWYLVIPWGLYPYVITGLVERHIRTELRSRTPVDRPTATPISTSSTSSLGRTLPVTLAAMGFVMAILAVFDIDGAATLIVSALGLGTALAVALLPRSRRIANQLAPQVMAQLPSRPAPRGMLPGP